MWFLLVTEVYIAESHWYKPTVPGVPSITIRNFSTGDLPECSNLWKGAKEKPLKAGKVLKLDKWSDSAWKWNSWWHCDAVRVLWILLWKRSLGAASSLQRAWPCPRLRGALVEGMVLSAPHHGSGIIPLLQGAGKEKQQSQPTECSQLEQEPAQDEQDCFPWVGDQWRAWGTHSSVVL